MTKTINEILNEWDGTLPLPTGAATSAKQLPDNHQVTVSNPTETNSAAIKTAVEIIDNAISGNEMQVDVVTMPAVTVTGVATETTLQKLVGFDLPECDAITHSYNAGTFTDTYLFKTGGAGGTTVATVTVIFTDATKSNMVSAVRT